MSEISITQAEFEQFRALMHQAAGVDLPPQKISLVTGLPEASASSTSRRT